MCTNPCRNPGYENVPVHEKFQDMEIILNVEAKNHTIIHRTTIGRRNQMYLQVCNLYTHVLH